MWIEEILTLLQTKKIYTFDFTDKLQFGDLSQSVLNRLFADGRYCSEPLSHTFHNFFTNLTYVDRKGYDFEHPDFRFIEQKQITKRGLKFCPSSMLGTGRTIEPDVVRDHIHEFDLHYLLPCIVDFPVVRVVLLSGLELLDKCTTKSCSFSRTDAIKKLIEPYATESE